MDLLHLREQGSLIDSFDPIAIKEVGGSSKKSWVPFPQKGVKTVEREGTHVCYVPLSPCAVVFLLCKQGQK
jgi:hypothetical protein